MHCPICGFEDTRVVDSRLISEGHQVRRRRECQKCHERFSTYETVELSMPKIVKSDGSRETFNEAKLRSGIELALEKRPVSTEQVERAIDRIMHRLATSGDREVPSRVIGEAVMSELQALDHVAYIRFASVYRSFQDIDAFKEAVDRLLADRGHATATPQELATDE